MANKQYKDFTAGAFANDQIIAQQSLTDDSYTKVPVPTFGLGDNVANEIPVLIIYTYLIMYYNNMKLHYLKKMRYLLIILIFLLFIEFIVLKILFS
jgi:hypothetical protein